MQNRRNHALFGFALTALVRGGEGAAILLLGLFLRVGQQIAPSPLAVAVLTLAFALVARAVGGCSLAILRKPLHGFLRVAGAWSAVVTAATALGLAFGVETLSPRGWLADWFAAGLFCFAATRALAALAAVVLARRGLLDRYIVIVGGGAPAEELLVALNRAAPPNVRILGLFDDRDEDRSPDLVAGFPKLGAIDDLIGFARNVPVDQIIFALPVQAEARIMEILHKLWVLPVDIRLAAHANRLRFRPRAYSFFGDVPLFDLLDRPMSDGAAATKALFDRLMALILIVLLAPVMLAIALGVRLSSPGPILFRQQRLGFNNERITILKFRSLHVGDNDPDASRLVTRADPRMTPFGRLIRKSSLDELPQLFNVLRGDLSLVGPRPHALGALAADRAYDQVVDGYFARHKVKPGVTGWAQINGWRGETDTFEKIQRRVDHDLDYIENWSIWFDLYILAATPFALARGRNAF